MKNVLNTAMETSEEMRVFNEIMKLIDSGYDVTLRSMGNGQFKIAKAKPQIVSMD